MIGSPCLSLIGSTRLTGLQVRCLESWYYGVQDDFTISGSERTTRGSVSFCQESPVFRHGEVQYLIRQIAKIYEGKIKTQLS